jgi:hypothetical protein
MLEQKEKGDGGKTGRLEAEDALPLSSLEGSSR